MSPGSHSFDSSPDAHSHSFQKSAAYDVFPSRPLDSMQFLAHLLHLRQALMVPPHAVVEAMCHEIAIASQGHAQLHVYSKSRRPVRVPPSWQSFPVEMNGREYGTLSFAPDVAAPDRLVVPVVVAQVAATLCALFLSSIELTLLSRGSDRPGNVPGTPTFTPREREVLALICRGYDLQAIADTLHIAEDTAGQHRRRIYAKLGAQNEREAVFVAFSAGLFFPLGDLAPRLLPD